VNARLALSELRNLYSSRGNNRRQSRVIYKACVILAVTAWETFVEDIIRVCAEQKIERAESPEEVRSIFNSVAHSYHEKHQNFTPDLYLDWTGKRWKDRIREKLEDDLSKLNTPSPDNIQKLSRRYLGGDITTSWHWRGMRVERTKRKLDSLIKWRGYLAHRISDFFGDEDVVAERIGENTDGESEMPRLNSRTILGIIDFIENLINRTYEAVLVYEGG